MKILPFLFDATFVLFKMYTKIYTSLAVDVQNSYSSANLKKQRQTAKKR